MNNKSGWTSKIGPRLEGFLNFMRLSGYQYKIQERWLRQLDQYCLEKNVSESELTKDVIESFCLGDGSESMATRQDRRRLIRKLAEYLRKCDWDVYIPPLPEKPFRYPRHQPYIYTEDELSQLFTQIDNWEQSPQSHSNRKIIDPLLFRMLYGCGLRITEALHLTISDVDLAEGVLKIRQAKNQKQRLVPMAEGLTNRCRAYFSCLHSQSEPGSYFYPGFHGGCYDSSTIYVRFRQYLWKAGISHSGSGPRVHDLRHAYCVHRLKKWVLEGKDLTNLMPYLSVYLGHTDFRGTEYYLRLTADLYPDIISKLEKSHGYIIPESGAKIP
jgi:integrase/recombinase XerD